MKLARARVVVVAQVVEQFPPMPKISGLNPSIGGYSSFTESIDKAKVKEKQAGIGKSFETNPLKQIILFRNPK